MGDNLFKIQIELPQGAPTATETLWAERIDVGLYRVDNTPWYARGVALDDLVRCEENLGEIPTFRRVVTPSGIRTIRIFVPDGEKREAIKRLISAGLGKLGCGFEGMGTGKGLIAASVPRDRTKDTLDWLNQLEADGLAYWESGNF